MPTSFCLKTVTVSAPFWLWGEMRSWFVCWFWRCIHCLLVCLASPLTSFFLYLFFLTYLLAYLPFSFRIGPLHFQAGGHKRRPNLGLSCFSLFWVIVCLCSWCMVILRCSKFSYLCQPRFIVYFWGCFSWFWFCFLSTSQEIGWKEHLQSDLFCVEWDVKKP